MKSISRKLRDCSQTAWLVFLGLVLARTGFGAEANGDAAPQQTSSTNAFFVYGTVSSPGGEPMSGVKVIANCGIGTLFPTGHTETDHQGHYRLVFRPGVLMGRGMNPGSLGVGLQAATIFARKSGYYAADLGRQGNLAMTDETNPPPSGFKGVVHPYKPYRLDFVLRPAATVHGKLKSAGGLLPPGLRLEISGKTLPPSCSILATCEPGIDGAFQFQDVPVGYEWWFEASWRENGEWKSAKSRAFLVSETKNYEAALNLKGRALEGPVK